MFFKFSFQDVDGKVGNGTQRAMQWSGKSHLLSRELFSLYDLHYFNFLKIQIIVFKKQMFSSLENYSDKGVTRHLGL